MDIDKDALTLHPRRVLRCLLILVALLLVASLATQGFKFLTGHGKAYGLIPAFDVDREANIPTYFSGLALFVAAALLALIAARKARGRERDTGYWSVLACLLLYVSLDEMTCLHEKLILPLQHLLRTGDLLYFAWVIVAIPLLALLGVVFLRFIWRLPRPFRRLFLLAALLYIGGGLGVEMAGGWYVSHWSPETYPYVLLTTLEEGLEMCGTSVFIYALLEYIAANWGEIRLRVAA